MLALVIDTSSAAVTAGVVDVSAGEVRVLANVTTVDARAHGELLGPSIRRALAEAGADISAVAAVAAGVGPGPFTGLRVGLVTAAAICDACAIPAYDVCSLDAIAVVASASAAAGPVGLADPNDPGAPLLVAADARRKEVYWARYVEGVRQDGPAVARPADLAAHLDAVAMAGAGARLYRDVFGLPLLDADHPTVLGLAELAADRIRAGAPSEPLTPLYLRRPDAVAPAALKLVSQR